MGTHLTPWTKISWKFKDEPSNTYWCYKSLLPLFISVLDVLDIYETRLLLLLCTGYKKTTKKGRKTQNHLRWLPSSFISCRTRRNYEQGFFGQTRWLEKFHRPVILFFYNFIACLWLCCYIVIYGFSCVRSINTLTDTHTHIDIRKVTNKLLDPLLLALRCPLFITGISITIINLSSWQRWWWNTCVWG